MTNPTICLNMIVKNERKVILRLLESCLPIIDSYCICDTGSTDDTVILIKDYFKEHKIPGKVVFKEFVNFEVNRNYSLEQAKIKSELFEVSDYLLFLDADMILKIGPSFNKKNLTQDAYMIIQGNNSFNYYNLRIISTKINVKVRCPTHEYYDILDSSISKNKMEKNVIFIHDIGDGGSKENKFKRDIVLLLDGLKEDPNNCRYYFYLANSYYDLGEYENSIINYKKRIELGGWNEEVFYSWYKLGLSYKKLNKEEEMINSWIEGYNALPERVETLYEIIKHYRIQGKYKLCNLFYQTAKNISFPKNCTLFIHNDVYNYLLLEEYTIFGYYIGHRKLHIEMFLLMQLKPKEQIYNIFSNYKFYQFILNADKVIKLNNKYYPEFSRNILDTDNNFTTSTSSIIENGEEGFLLNIRNVNYKILNNGKYDNNKYIITINKKVWINENYELIKIEEFEHIVSPKKYIGVEDIKLFKLNDKIMYSATGYLSTNKIGIVYGDYLNNEIKELSYQNQQNCEKNWVFNEDGYVIYKWFPLTIGKINKENELIIEKNINTPNLFSVYRGSSIGYLYNNEWWYLTHNVFQNNNSPRDYYHSLVILDRNYNVLKYTIPFKFTDNTIEYALGLIVKKDKIIITNSCMDRESYIREYKKDYIDKLFNI
jgi:tetratricopeptide (TPR) repeat protein